MDPNQPMYWAERWELFKHTYIVAGWGWKRAITKVEYWARAALLLAHARMPGTGTVRVTVR
jgi:hypothetical protein